MVDDKILLGKGKGECWFRGVRLTCLVSWSVLSSLKLMSQINSIGFCFLITAHSATELGTAFRLPSICGINKLRHTADAIFVRINSHT